MDEDPTSGFETSVNNQFAFNGLGDEDIFDLPSPSIDPRTISHHGELGQNQVGTGRSLWSTGPATHQTRQVAPRPAQRTVQQQSRSIPMKSTSSSGKDALGLGQEMRSAAQRVRSLGGQLADMEKSVSLPISTFNHPILNTYLMPLAGASRLSARYRVL